MNGEEPSELQWHLDKRVPIAVISTLLIQSAAILWWAAGVSFRIDQLEKSDIARSTQADRIVRVETRLDAVFMSLDEIKHLLRTPADQRR